MLCRRAKISFLQGVTVEGLGKVAALPEFCDHPVIVYSTRSYMTPIAKFNLDGEEKELFLLLDSENHFSAIVRLNAFMGKTGVFCRRCDKFFTGVSRTHTCDGRLCKQCKTYCGPQDRDLTSEPGLRCDSCKRGFLDHRCFDNHLRAGASPLLRGAKTVCESFVACPRCHRDLKAKDGVSTGRNAYDPTTEHECFKSKCFTCGKMVETSKHLCFIRKLRLSNPKTEKRYGDSARGEFWFYDMETCVKEKEDGSGLKYFEPNVISVQHESGDHSLAITYVGDDCLEKFCKFAFVGEDSKANDDHRHTFVAHNGARFDAMFIMDYAARKFVQKQPAVMFDGCSVLQIKYRNCYFIDSYRYIPTLLSAFPDQFDFRDEVEKGDFPHEFNRQENYDYEGLLPPEETYGTRFMTEKRYRKFKAWYDEENRKIAAGEREPWRFEDEICKYCELDVTVLRRGWTIFAKAMRELTGLWPGIENATGAKFTNLVWKTTIESDNEFGIIPSDNYFHQDHQSKVALEWLT